MRSIEASLMHGESQRIGTDGFWRRIAAKKKSTWPPTPLAPSGRYWSILSKRGNIQSFSFNGEVKDSIVWSRAVAYADPADLAPSWA